MIIVFFIIICQSQEIKLYPFQDYVETTNYDYVEVLNCKNLVAFIQKEQKQYNYTVNLNSVQEIINIKKVAITVGNEQTYCFGILYNKTFIQFMQDQPQFFFKSNYLGLEYNLAEFPSNNHSKIKICNDIYRTLENTKFYLLCSDEDQYRIFVEIEFQFICLNTTKNKEMLNKSITTYKLDQINQSVSTRYIYYLSQIIIILYNSDQSLFYHCDGTCHQLEFNQQIQTCKITDIQLSYFDNDSFQFVQFCYEEGLYFLSYNLTSNTLNIDNMFKSYDNENYFSLSLYKQNLQYGIEPILVYPEVALLTSNFIYSFYLFKKNDQLLNQRFINKVRISQLSNQYPQELSQDESYFYIYQVQPGNYSITQYSKNPPLSRQTYQINHTNQNIQPQFTFYDTKNYLSTLHKQNIAIYYYDSNWQYTLFKVNRKTLNIRAQNHIRPQNCTLKYNQDDKQTFQVELILLQNKNITIREQNKIEEYSDIIKINLNDYFEGQLIEYDVKQKSRRISNFNITQNYETIFPNTKFDTPQSHDIPTKIKAIYDHDSNICYSIYQGSNQVIFIIKGIETIAQFQEQGDLVNFERYGDQLVYSIKNSNKTQIINKIFDIKTKSTKEITFPQQFENLNIGQIKGVNIFTSPYQKNFYYLVDENEKQYLFYYKYEQILDQNFEQYCFEIEYYKLTSLDLTLSQQNIYFAIGLADKIREIVYFRLPIQKFNYNCNDEVKFKLKPTKLQFDSNNSRYRQLDFRIVDFRFIDYSKPPAILIFDLELNTLTMHYLRDLFNIDYKREGVQLPIFLNNLNLSFLNDLQSFPVGYNSYSTFGSMGYAIVNFQYLILQITDSVEFYELQIYDLLEVSGNQVRQIKTKFENVNLHYIAFSHLIQQTANKYKNTISFVKLQLENNPLESSYNNISFYTQFDPIMIIDLKQSLQLSKVQVFEFKINASNNYDSKIQNLNLKFNLKGLAVTPNFTGTKELNDSKKLVDFSLTIGSVEHNYIYANDQKTIINLIQINNKSNNCNYTNQSILFSHNQDLFYYLNHSLFICNQCNQYYASTNDILNYTHSQMINCNKQYILLNNNQSLLLCIEKHCTVKKSYENQIIKATQIICMNNSLIISVLISFDYNDDYEDDQILFYLGNQLETPNDFKINAKTFDQQLNYVFTSLKIYAIENKLEVFLKQDNHINYLISFYVDNQKIIMDPKFKTFIEYYRQDESSVFYSQNTNSIINDKTNISYNQYYYCSRLEWLTPYYFKDSNSFIQFLNCSDQLSIAYYIDNMNFTSQVYPVTNLENYQYSWIYNNLLYVALTNQLIISYKFNHNLSYGDIISETQFQQCSNSQKDLSYTCVDIQIDPSKQQLDDYRESINKYFYWLIIPIYVMSILGNLLCYFQIKKITKNNQTSSIEFNERSNMSNQIQ
ncbi:hypothetical protein pb186bvf_020056 [Paramecium bursaria]